MRRVVLLALPFALACAHAPAPTSELVAPAPAATRTHPVGPTDEAGRRFLASPRVRVPLEAAPTTGSRTPLVELVVFSDFECPFCFRGAQAVAYVLRHHADEVRVHFRNLPLPMHRHAALAAEAALEAGAQGGDEAFFQMHDLLFTHQDALAPTNLETYAAELGLDVPRFRDALARHVHAPRVARDAAAAEALGIEGTPAFFLNGHRIEGAYPPARFDALVHAELEAARARLDDGVPREALYAKLMEEAAPARPDPFAALAEDEGRSYYELAVPDDAPSVGEPAAPVVLQIFTDLECPYCARLAPVLAAVRQRYGDRLRLVHRAYPLAQHPHAMLAAEAALEVFAQRGAAAYERFVALAYANPSALERADLERYARQLDVDLPRLRRALDQHVHRERIVADVEALRALGAPELMMPTVLVNGRLVVGAKPFEVYDRLIDLSLEEAGW